MGVLLILTLLTWGLWGFLPKLATIYFEPKSVLIFQSVGSIIVTLLVLVSVNFRPETHLMGVTFAVLAGLTGSIGAFFFLQAMTQLKASVVVTVTALYPIVTIILSALVLKETVTLKQSIGMVLALLAIILFTT